MKKVIMLLFIVAIALPLFANGASEVEESGVIKVALILPSSADDKGWSQGMYNAAVGVAEASGGKMMIEYSENMAPVDAGSAARQYIAQGFTYILFHGTQYGNTITDMAGDFPEVTFIFGTSGSVMGDNIVSYMPATEEPGYLSGMIAGMATKADKVGIVGPVDGGDAAQYNRGYWLGVEAVNPGAEIGVAHTGSFSDYVKAGELAHTYIDEGYDMLAGSSQQGLGALQAVAQYPDKHVYWMGSSELHFEGPEGYKLLAACSYYWDPIYNTILDSEAGGTRMGGEVLYLTFANGGFTFSMAEDNPVITDEIKAAVAEAKEDIMSGALTVDWKSVEY